jgi:hypothetical protein
MSATRAAVSSISSQLNQKKLQLQEPVDGRRLAPGQIGQPLGGAAGQHRDLLHERRLHRRRSGWSDRFAADDDDVRPLFDAHDLTSSSARCRPCWQPPGRAGIKSILGW